MAVFEFHLRLSNFFLNFQQGNPICHSVLGGSIRSVMFGSNQTTCWSPFQQLHSSVRTGNLETCLRLLSLGAQANFFHPVGVREQAKKKTHLFCEVARLTLTQCWRVLIVLFGTTGEREHSATHSSKSRTNVTGWTVGGLWSWSRGPGLQWKDPHWLCKVKCKAINSAYHF